MDAIVAAASAALGTLGRGGLPTLNWTTPTTCRR
jgi:hypothetical protein